MANYRRPKILCVIGDCIHKAPIGTGMYSNNFLQCIDHTSSDYNLKVLSLSETLTPWNHGKHPSSCFRLIRKALFILKSIKTVTLAKPSLILCLEESLSPLCFWLHRYFGLNYAVFAHDPRLWAVPVLKKSLLSSKWVIANSTKTKQTILSNPGITNKKVYVIHPYVDGKVFYPHARNSELIKKYRLGDKRVILTVARFDRDALERKKHDSVVRALGAVKKRIPNIVYLIVGPGDQEDLIRNLAHQCGVLENICFVGTVDRRALHEYYNLCDLYVMPSVNEGFGMAYIEALACGKPVIGGIYTGAEDALLSGRLGLLIDQDDIECIAESIIDVLEGTIDPNLINADYLRKTVLRHHGMKNYLSKLDEFFNYVFTTHSQPCCQHILNQLKTY